MVTKDEAIKAAEMLKEWCEGHLCKACPFGERMDVGEYKCYFASGCVPFGWNIPKPCRWTDTDVELAKALKKAGADKVLRIRISEYVVWESSDQRGCVPKGSFEALSSGESVDLDTIIQEAKGG